MIGINPEQNKESASQFPRTVAKPTNCKDDAILARERAVIVAKEN